MSAGWIALMALVPLMVGPLPGEERTLVASLCNGGTLWLPLGKGEPEPVEQAAAKGCHAGCLRKRGERSQ